MKSDVAVEVLGAILSTILLGIGAIALGRHIADNVERINPTCSRAAGLRPIPPSGLSASGPSRSGFYPPQKAVDGFLGSIWVPPLLKPSDAADQNFSPSVPVFSADPKSSTLTLSLKTKTHVRLVCVNNGFGAGDTRYENFGKVRTMETWGDEDTARRTVILSSLPADESATLQEPNRDLGTVKAVHLQLIDAYSGKDVVTYDPDQCGHSGEPSYKVSSSGIQRLYSDGCVLSASPKAGLSEVVLYTSGNA